MFFVLTQAPGALTCNQAGRCFSGVEVEVDVNPLDVYLRTSSGTYKVYVSLDTVFQGILPTLRAFVLKHAQTLGVTIANESGGRKSTRTRLVEALPIDQQGGKKR